MKKLVVPFLFFLVLAGCSGAEKALPQNFSITIHRWGLMIGADKITTVTQDSIEVRTMNLVDTTPAFRKKLTATEKQSIAEALSGINLDELKNDYTNNNAPDDLGEYDFTIRIDKKTKAFHIYQVKLEGILNLVKKINAVLPKEEQVGYNDEYFRN